MRNSKFYEKRSLSGWKRNQKKSEKNLHVLALSIVSLMVAPRASRLRGPAGLRESLTAFSLEIRPSLHNNLTRVKLSFILDTSLLRRLARNLPGVTPGKVIKFPKGVRRQDQIPHGQ
jgi:hypothetical protein